MPIRKIVVPVDGTPAVQGALETALFLGGWLEAHVEAVHVRVEPTAAVPLVGEGMSGALVQDLIELTERESAGRAAAAKVMFEDARARAGIATEENPTPSGASARFIEFRGIEEDEVVRRARLADLVVIGRPIVHPEVLSTVPFNALIFESAAPVMVAAAAAPDALRRIVVAWNDSKECARAMKYALPLLHRAARVEVISVGADPDVDSACADAVRFLAWHGIAATPRIVAESGSPDQTLSDACKDADMVVMGAYTHNRLWQMILGSVTRHMIERTSLLLFMAH
jgi:nucleotide-binding universal stress UspA family protein